MNVYIGYDSREAICYDTCRTSIEQKMSRPVPIAKLSLDNIKSIYNRVTDVNAATEFAYSRFLVPYLCNFTGWAVFCDCDFIFLDDIYNLLSHADPTKAVIVCKHDYIPTNTVKMDGQKQTTYPRKNWSSLILWNCSHPSNKMLSPETINTQTGKYLHRFEWLDDEEIGNLPVVWNWLVGWYKEPRDGQPKALHYTEGGPWFENYKNCEYSEVWNKHYEMCCRR